MVVRDLHRDLHDRVARYELLAELEANNLNVTIVGRTRIRNFKPPGPIYLSSEDFEDSESKSDSEIYK